MSEAVEKVRDGRVLRVRLNRAERRNVLSRAMCGALLEAFADAGSDEGTGAILLESSGPVFCGGWDADEAVTRDDLLVHDALLNYAGDVMKPVVAAVQGPALGPGVALLANAAVVVAAQGATFAMTDIRSGRFPFIAFGPLSRAVGERRAMELCLTGRVFTVPEAIAWGLVHHTAPAFEFDDRAMSIAGQLAGSGAAAEGLRFMAGRRASDRDERSRALEGAIEHSAKSSGTLNSST